MCTLLSTRMLLDMRTLLGTISGSLFIGHALGHAPSGWLSGMGLGMATVSVARRGPRQFVFRV